MRSYTLLAPAKINLYLEIIGHRPDGYHELVMIMQSVDLADEISLRANGTTEFVVHCNHPLVPGDRTNLAYKAAALMAQRFPDVFDRFGGAEITVRKNIPVGAGLAGGSTNAAAVLVGLDLMWGLGLTQVELQELGAKLGSDVPFCVAGGTAIATGRGEKLAPLPDLDSAFVVLAKHRNLSVSTPWAYQTYRQQFGDTYLSDHASLEERRQRIHCGGLVGAIAHRDYRAIGAQIHNDLEKVVLPAHPQVGQLRNEMARLSSLGGMMSGSGPTVFALAESRDEADEIVQQVKAALPDPEIDLWVARMTPTGVRLKGET
jgi:4-diphosphocytidyl-2-C-methyl-D-erythritol kinase